MKSLVQEASSISKAIELGWVAAGKPQEFSIQILEEAQKNFIGMTTKPAKVIVFFGEKKTRPDAQRERNVRSGQRPQTQQSYDRNERQERGERPDRRDRADRQDRNEQRPERRDRRNPERPFSQQPAENESGEAGADRPQRSRSTPLWNDDMITAARAWLDTTFATMQKMGVSFTIEPQNFFLRVTLNEPLVEDSTQERKIFANVATLLLETLKKKFRSGLRGHKVIITHEKLTQ